MLEKVNFPEELGVNSDVVKGYIDYLESNNIQMDSFMVIKDGKIACEAYWSPNDESIPHDMYSLSKSIMGIAIGLAVDEGIIDLNTKVYKTYFPEKLAKLKGKQRKWAEKLTIHHVIAMQAGKVTSVLANKEKENWIDTLLDVPFKVEPGTDWKYVSENAHLLAWILHKETGLTVTEFLTPRFYEPLDIEVPQWDKSSEDIEAGGWGIKLKTLDIAKISQVFLSRGMYGDKRIFSEEWYEKCTYPYSKKLYPIFTDGSEYGYQIWIDHEIEDTTLRFTGLYGQFSFMFPKQNAAVIMTARDNRDEIFIKPLFKYFPRAFTESADLNDDKKQAFAKFMASRKIAPFFENEAKRNTTMEKKINGRTIKLANVNNLSVIGATTFFMWRQRTGSLNDLKFEFTEDGVDFTFTERNNGTQTIHAGMNGEFARNYIKLGEDIIVADAQATWKKNGTFEIYFNNTGRAQAKRFTFRFIGNVVTVKGSSEPGYDALFKFNIQFTNGIRVSDPLYAAIKLGVPVFNKCYADPDSIGKFID